MNSLADVRNAFVGALSATSLHVHRYPPEQIDAATAVPFYRSLEFDQTFGEPFGRMLWGLRITTRAGEAASAFSELEELIVTARDAVDDPSPWESRGLSARVQSAEQIDRSDYASIPYFSATLLVEVIPS